VASSKGSKAKAKSPAKKKASIPPSAASPTQWVVVQLTALGEREKNLALIVRSAHQILGHKLEVFVPAINQKGLDDSLTTWYSEGYVFIQHESGVGYHKLAETNYFSTVLSTMAVVNGEKKRMYSLLTDKDLKHMRNGMQELKVTASRFKMDQEVRITKGSYKGLPGAISLIYDDGEKVQVFVKLKSIKGGGLFMDFPASYIQKIDP
jgi:transcription antitermination factor NusG